MKKCCIYFSPNHCVWELLEITGSLFYLRNIVQRESGYPFQHCSVFSFENLVFLISNCFFINNDKGDVFEFSLYSRTKLQMYETSVVVPLAPSLLSLS